MRSCPALRLPVLAVLLALPIRGEEFALEHHIPADFRYRYLSISPDLNFHASDEDQHGTENGWDGDRRDAVFGLRLRHGAQLSTRRLLMSLGNGLDFRRNDTWSAYGVPYATDRFGSGSEREGGSWNYGLHANPSVQWFPLPKLSLSASAESRFHRTPMTPSASADWRLTRPSGLSPDSVEYSQMQSRGRSGGLAAGLKARAAVGIGRIEKVGHADRVLHLLDRIAEVTGRPVRISPGEMHALEARMEARRKQRGFLDRRRASLHDLETVEMFLRDRGKDSAGAAGDMPPRALLAMADEWFLGTPRDRESGFEARLQPYLAWTWNDSRDWTARYAYARTLPADSAVDPARLAPRADDSAVTRTSESRWESFQGERILGLGLEAAWRRPWRRRFQLDADASARASARKVESSVRSSHAMDGASDPGEGGRYIEFEYTRVEGRWGLALSWYPDSRSRFTGGAGGSGARALDYLGSRASLAAWLGREPDLHAWNLDHRLHAEAEYRPGYGLSFTAGAAAESYWGSSADHDLELQAHFPPYGPVRRGGLNRSVRLWANLEYYLF